MFNTFPNHIQDVRLNFRCTTASVTGYNTLFSASGPHLAVISGTDLNDFNGNKTQVGVTTISTANWSGFGGCSCSCNDAVPGITGGTYLTGATTGVYSSIIFNYGGASPATYDAAKPQFRISKLDPAIEYEIKITGADGTLSGFDSNPSTYRVVGETSPASQQINGDITNVTTGATFTLRPKEDGTIDIWANTSLSPSADLVSVCGITIKELY